MELDPKYDSNEEKIKDELETLFQSKKNRIFSKIISAALGIIPWVGGYLSAIESYKSGELQVKHNLLYEQWLTVHADKMNTLRKMLSEILKRFEEFSDDINERLESEEYLQIVKKAFRSWDNADTTEKQELIRKLIANAGAHKLVTDDLIRLFIDWLNLYHEIHFAVIR